MPAIETKHLSIEKIQRNTKERPLSRGDKVTGSFPRYRSGLSVEEIIGGLSIALACGPIQTLSYYFDNKDEIDRELA